MQIEVVYAASKREQSLRDAPSAISVVTAAEIRQQGYRTLADILRSLASFYTSSDRNYEYLGVRGFGRPGDYNSRILLLVNGLRTNDNIYGTAYIGHEFLVDVDLIDRVEVVRGPSSALYGSGAFFAVVNVVTRRGGDIGGTEVAGSAGSFETFGGRATYGRSLPSGFDVLVSASVADRGGPDQLYFREFDDPSTNEGIARAADGESFHKILASITRGGFSLHASSASREKGIPTAAYGTVFNDPRTRTTDGTTLTSVAYARAFGRGSGIDARVSFGQYHYEGAYSYDPSLLPNQDESDGEWWGTDISGTLPRFARNLVTVGAEFMDDYRQDQRNFDVEPAAVYTDIRASSQRVAVFAQDEIELHSTLALHLGVRQDWYETVGSATSPRLGLIYTPDRATTLKVMLGRAFRAPNEYELRYNGPEFKASTGLDPERIETLELVAERLIGGGLRVSAAGFRNRIDGLISLYRDPADDLLTFTNFEDISSNGLELGLDLNRGRGTRGRLSYALQRSEDRATGVVLTNSPRHMAKAQTLTPLGGTLTAGIDAQYMSGRTTLAGARTKECVMTGVTLLAPRILGYLGLNADVYNIFDSPCGAPGSVEHLQDIIEQDGRSFRLKATFHF
jgi:iron complex outermembrane receptor protein